MKVRRCLTFLQVLGDVPIRRPGCHNGETDPSSRRGIRNPKDIRNQVRVRNLKSLDLYNVQLNLKSVLSENMDAPGVVPCARQSSGGILKEPNLTSQLTIAERTNFLLWVW